MARIKNGITGPVVGKVGNLVFYMLKGENHLRSIGTPNPNRSNKQRGNEMKMALTSSFAKSVHTFLEVGFKNASKKKDTTPRNYAISANKETAIIGMYPDQKINFEALKFSEGDVAVPKNSTVKLIGNVLHFTWEADLSSEGADPRDQVMLIAYFPETSKAITLQSGARRTAEKESLQLTGFTNTMVIETYIAFISDNREDVSNSIHVAQLIWDQNSAADGNA